MRGRGLPAEATRLHLAVFGDAKRAEVDLQDVTAGCIFQPGEDRRITHGLKSRERAPTEQPYALVAVSAPDHRPIGIARVGCRQFESVGPEKIASAQPDREPGFVKPAGAFQLAGSVASALQCGEWL